MIALSRLGTQLLSHRNEIHAAGGDLSKIEVARTVKLLGCRRRKKWPNVEGRR